MIDLRTYKSVTEKDGVITAVPTDDDNARRNYPAAQGGFVVCMPGGEVKALRCMGWDGGVWDSATNPNHWHVYPTAWRFHNIDHDEAQGVFALFGRIVAQKVRDGEAVP